MSKHLTNGPLKLASRAPASASFRGPLPHAFTLVEMMVTIAIVGILVAMLFPALQSVRQSARRTTCSANLRQIAIATLNYETARRQFPAGDDGKGGNYIVSILAHLKQEYLYVETSRALSAGETWRDRMIELSELQVKPLICPASNPGDKEVSLEDVGRYTTHYYGLLGPIGNAQTSDESRRYSYSTLGGSETSEGGPIGMQGIFSPNSQGKFVGKKMKDVRDGTSYTFGFGEISGFDNTESRDAIPRAGWALGAVFGSNRKPDKIYSLKSVAHSINYLGSSDFNTTPFSSNHPQGAQFAFLDGAIRFVDERVSLDVLKFHCSIDAVEKPEELDNF